MEIRIASANFKDQELACHGRDCCNYSNLCSPILIAKLELTRWFGQGRPLTISRAYSCPIHNAEIQNGLGRTEAAIKNCSYHVLGLAVDVTRWGEYDLSKETGRDVARKAISGLFLQTGWWVLDEGNHIHADLRYWHPRPTQP